MGFLDKAKAAAEQAAVKAKEGFEELQYKRELGQSYNALGKAAYELIESGEVAHDKLDAPAAKVRALLEKAAADDEASDPAEAEPESGEPSDSQEPDS